MIESRRAGIDEIRLRFDGVKEKGYMRKSKGRIWKRSGWMMERIREDKKAYSWVI
jgi:hypothetical protein